MTVRNENLYLDMAIGVAVVATVVFVFAMVLMPTFYALLTALVLSFLFNWLHFRRHLSRITISNKGEVELWDIRGRLHRITRLSHIDMSLLEGECPLVHQG
jgi:membrane protein implicated in regulation of membrane protease activity